jgi:tetratricopeptide (TPR) repeat protein
VATAKPALVARAGSEYAEVAAAVKARRYVTAYKILEKWPEPLWSGLGQDFQLLSGFLDYKAEFYSDAIEELKPLSENAAYVARRPEVLYYLGRAYYAGASYGKAVDAFERFVRSQALLGRPLLPQSAKGGTRLTVAPTERPPAAARDEPGKSGRP